jgi:hypothetical protein
MLMKCASVTCLPSSVSLVDILWFGPGLSRGPPKIQQNPQLNCCHLAKYGGTIFSCIQYARLTKPYVQNKGESDKPRQVVMMNVDVQCTSIMHPLHRVWRTAYVHSASILFEIRQALKLFADLDSFFTKDNNNNTSRSPTAGSVTLQTNNCVLHCRNT